MADLEQKEINSVVQKRLVVVADVGTLTSM